MGEKNNQIAVCVPTYNRSNYLTECINSILAQTYKNFELIICNDGSTDNTESIIRSFKDQRIRYIKNEKNIGYVPTINKCVNLASGGWIMFLSDDDILLPEILATFLKYIVENKNKEIGYIVSQSLLINSLGNTINIPRKQFKNDKYFVLDPKEFIFNFTLYGKKIKNKYKFNTSFPGTLFNKNIFIKTGMSSKEVPVTHDLLIESKICLKYSIIVVDEPLIKYRVHENWGASLNQRGKFLEEYLKYLGFLLEFIKKEKIFLDYDFERYCYNSLINYLFSPNGGLIRLAARFKGNYIARVKLIWQYAKFAVQTKKNVLVSPLFYIVSIASLLPQGIILRIGKIFGKI